MFFRTEGFQLLVQLFGFLYSGGFIQGSLMWYQAVSEGMMTEILMILICVTSACFRCVEQGEADRMVIRLVPSIFAVVHHRYTITSVTIGQVGPILCIYFVSCFGIVATLYAADTQVVRSLFVFDIEREFGF